MTRSYNGMFWVLAVLGTCQAALAASILFAESWAWVLTAAGYVIWLAVAGGGRVATVRACLTLGYLVPLLAFAAVYAARALPSRPEAAEARLLMRFTTTDGPPIASDVPAPRLVPPGTSRRSTRAAWLLSRSFLYLAGCAVAGLLLHTPGTVYLAAAVVGVFTLGREDER